jgi:hypothetical protein
MWVPDVQTASPGPGGLVNRCAPADDIDTAAEKIAHVLAPRAIRA